MRPAPNIWAILESAAERHGDRIAVVDGDRRFTYSETRARSAALALRLADRGIAAGDRVAILDANTHTFLQAYFAAAGLGAVLVPLNTRLLPAELGAIVQDSGARILIAGHGFRPLAEDLLDRETPLEGVLHEGESEEGLRRTEGRFSPHAVREGDIAHLYYTSGTTGRPKGVILTHRNVCLHARLAAEELRLVREDVWGHIAPMFHLADAWATFAITSVGARHVMVGRFDAETVLETVARERITVTNLIPAMLNRMIRHPLASEADHSSLRVLLTGGAPIAPEVVRRATETFGCDYIQTYGMTETSPYLTLSILPPHLRALPPEERLVYQAKTGRAMKGVDLEVVDEAGSTVARDDRQVGEIRVRGETVSPGYWNRPEETREAFRDGWLMTGDLAVVDDEGFVNIVDRRKDMIICGGENVFSTEVENVLYEHPKILEAAAFGVPDETWGEVVAVAVVLRSGEAAMEEEIIGFVKERLASFKAPKTVVILEELPKTGSGKVSKRALRDRFGAR